MSASVTGAGDVSDRVEQAIARLATRQQPLLVATRIGQTLALRTAAA